MPLISELLVEVFTIEYFKFISIMLTTSYIVQIISNWYDSIVSASTVYSYEYAR
jgi:hypothetical protein